MARATGFFFMILAILAAGCTDGTAPAPGSATDADSTPTGDASDPLDPTLDHAADQAIEIVDCTYFPLTFEVPERTIEHAVPPDYEPIGFAPDLAQVNLMLLECAHVTISNHTVGRDVTIANLLVRVQPPEEFADGADIHFYNVETYASDEALVATLAGYGVPAVLGSVSWTRGEASYEASVTAQETLVYQINGGYGAQVAPVQKSVARAHYTASDGSPAWTDLDQTYQTAAWPSPGVVVAESGLLAEALTEASPGVAGITGEGTYAATLSFHTGSAVSE